MLLFTNNADSTLRVGATATDTTLYLANNTGDRFPNPGVGDSFFLTLIDSLGNVEIVEATARNGDEVTVMRGRDGTTAKSFPQDSVVDHRLVAEAIRRMSPDSQKGIDGGIAPLDANGWLPEEHLPPSALTQTSGDARYVLLTAANSANGYAALDAGGKILMSALPDDLLTSAEGDGAYVPLSSKGTANGVAPLDADNKIPIAHIPAAISNIDMSLYAPLLDPVFTDKITAGGKATFGALAVTGASTLAAVQADTVATTGLVTIMGGAPRGKLTFSTSPPSGTPGPGDEWVQHEV